MPGTKARFLRRVPLASLRRNRLTVISLFSGCGGMDLGMRQAGFDIRVMVEWDKMACETLRRNWTRDGWRRCEPRGRRWPSWMQKREPAILEADITKLSTEQILEAADLKVGEAGVVIGGFPCQGFSTANMNRKRDAKTDPRNRLYHECVRVVREALPKYFVFENVPGLITILNGEVIDRICRDLAGVGYFVRWEKLNAADYGVPQNRIRVFFMGERQDLAWTDGKRIRLHLAVAGGYQHPAFFLAKYPRFKQVAA